MRYVEKIGYRERIMAAFSLLTIVVILLLYFVISYNHEKMIDENLQLRINLFSNIFQTIIYQEADSLNSQKFDVLLNTFGEYPAFKYIQIIDQDFKTVKNNIYDYEFFDTEKLKSVSEYGEIKEKLINKIHDNYYDIIFPININDNLAFYARVGFDFSYHKRINEFNKDYYILTFIIALIIANLLSFLIGNSLDKKIKQLVNYTNSIANGNLDAKFDYKWSHELGKLASAFNTMVNKLMESQEKLHSYQYSLEQKIAEQNKILFESEEKYRNLVEASPNVIQIIQNGRIVFTNSSIKKLFGIDKEEVIGKLIDEVFFISEKDRQKLVADLERIPPNDTSVYNFDFAGFDVNGKEYMIEVSVHHIQHNHKDALQMIIRDITQRKKFENDLLQFQKMESIGTLAGGIAHDFNNILGVIIPSAEMIKKMSSSSTEIYRDAEQIESAATKASELTSKLLSFAKKEELKKTIIHPNQIIENILKLITRVIGKNIKIETSFADKIKNIAVDVNQIEQVILNIVLNAQDAMPEGGKLSIKTDMIKNVPLEFKRPQSNVMNDIVRIQITDTGIGMSPETQKRIFEPFFTTKKYGHGTGLGLSTVYGILKNHHGTIFVKSKLNAGTTFTILLPSTSEKVTVKEETVITFTQGKGTILIIEDELMMLETCKNLCEHLGFDVMTATNGDEGIEIYKKHQKDIVLTILDMEMPGLNGLETFSKLQEINKKIKVIISSGFSVEGNVKNALEKGAKLFLKKPYRLKELSKSINKVIAHKPKV